MGELRLDPLTEFRAALGLVPGAPATPGIPKTHDGFSFTSFPNAGDVGLVDLLSPQVGVKNWPIADAGTLDGLATKRGVKSVSFDLVGYGTQATNGLGLEGKMNFATSTNALSMTGPGAGRTPSCGPGTSDR